MTLDDFRAVVEVHLMGAATCAKAVWPAMQAQNYGRLVFTTSSSGLYGHFGQSNYGAAKLALIGLMNTLKLEGAKHDIRINAISPVAATRMTENIFPEAMAAQFKPEAVTPGALFLAAEDAPNGAVLAAGAGVFALSRIFETEGVFLGDDPSPEQIRDAWSRISDPATQEAYTAGMGQTQKFLRKKSGG
jgi:NAD(P)-dependent dehydrogenase (short-subunit alcohol dehydrogenase family)